MVEVLNTGAIEHCDESIKKAAMAANAGYLDDAAGHLMDAARELSSRGRYHDSASYSAEAGGYYEILADEVGRTTPLGVQLLGKAGAAYLLAGETYSGAGARALARGCYDEAVEFFLCAATSGDKIYYQQLIQCLRYSAKCAKVEGMGKKAGEDYKRAARLTDNPSLFRRSDVLKYYMYAMLAYAPDGHRHEIEELYKRFCEILFDVCERKSTDEHFFNKLIPVFDEQGRAQLARKAYVDKMNFRFACRGRSFFPRLANAAGWLVSKGKLILAKMAKPWLVKSYVFLKRLLGLAGLAFWRIMGYGESGLIWLISSVVLVGFFAVLYTPLKGNNGPIALYVENSHTFAPDQGFLANIGSALSFSITVFTTLGFGDVVPSSGLAKFVVGLECFFGYLFLGMLITILGRKMLRR